MPFVPDKSNAGRFVPDSAEQSSPNEPIEQPTSLREKAYGLLRGATKSTVGGLGALESLAPHSGFQQVIANDIPKLMGFKGSETILPTPEQVSSGMSEIGLPPSKATTSETVGEFLPVGVGLAGLAEPVLKKGAEVGARLLPGATAKVESKLLQLAPKSNASELGEVMNKDLSTRLESLRKTRSAEAEKLKGEYFAQAKGKESTITREFQDYLLNDLSKNSKKYSIEQKKVIEDSYKRLEQNPSIDLLELELRRLKDVAKIKPTVNGVPVEGYDAAKVKQAGDVAKKLQDILDHAAPKGAKYRDAYTEASEPINLFDELMGRKAVGDEADPAKLPNTFFKSKDSLNRLRNLAGGDERIVEKYANQHIVNELVGKTSDEAYRWKQKNELWLKYLPNQEKTVNDYVKQLSDVEKTQHTAKNVGMITGGAIAGEALLSKLRQALGF